jgi:hypothetical protein
MLCWSQVDPKELAREAARKKAAAARAEEEKKQAAGMAKVMLLTLLLGESEDVAFTSYLNPLLPCVRTTADDILFQAQGQVDPARLACNPSLA